jgi:hypothetical protein
MTALTARLNTYITQGTFFTYSTEISREITNIERIVLAYLKIIDHHIAFVYYSLSDTDYTWTQKLKIIKNLVTLAKSTARVLHVSLPTNDFTPVSFEGTIFNLKISIYTPKYLLNYVLDQVQSVDLLNKFSPNTEDIESDGVFRLYDVT